MPEPQDALPPGPWKRGPAVGDDLYIVDADGAMIAGICGGGYDRQALAALLLRAPEVEGAARDMLDYLAGVGPCFLGAGMEESGLDQIAERLRMALGEQK